MQTILLFIDGLGWGKPDKFTNPQYSYGGQVFALPNRTTNSNEPYAARYSGHVIPLDAVLGVEGIPQSATGQTTLLSGKNAQEHLSKHLTGYPNDKLRSILLEHSILKTLTDNDVSASFINAYRPRFFEMPRERQLMFSATTVATLAADLPFFGLQDLNTGKSVYQEFTNQSLIERDFDVPLRTPSEAGKILATESQNYDFTLFEYFQTDKAGHTGKIEESKKQLQMLDEFVTTLLTELLVDKNADQLVLLTSDHGNLEDATTRRHTTNPVPLFAWGKNSREFLQGITRLDQVTPAIVQRHLKG